MDFSALLAELRDVAEKYRGKDAEPSISTVVYVDMFTKILKQVQKSVDDYEDQITVLWVTLNQLAAIYKELVAGAPRDQLCRFIFGMCARTVLNIQWPQLDEDSEIKQNFCTTVENVHKILSEQGLPRFQLILDLMESHWTHPILSEIMSAEDDVEGGLEYIRQEDPEILKLRIEIMMKENCEEFALNLCSWSLKNPALANDLKIKEWQIVMQYKQNEYGKMQEVCESIVCHNGIKVMSHLAKTPSNQELCIRLAQIFLIQDWIQSDRNCCTQELLKLWIHHQYLADKDEERFLESIWAVAKVSSTTDQIGVLIDGVRKECGEMFIQLYTDLCKFALNIDKGNMEQEIEKGNFEEVKTRQMRIAKTCIRLAFLIKDSDFHIARICGLTAFSLNPSTDSLNLVNKLYWTIKNASATSGKCKINPATLYEIERLLDLMRPTMLKPDLNWKQIIPLCKKYKIDREKVLEDAGGVYVPVVNVNLDVAVKVENIKLEDPVQRDTRPLASDKKQVKVESASVTDNIPSTCISSPPLQHKSSMSKAEVQPATVQAECQKSSSIETSLGSQFPSDAFKDLKDGPDLDSKDLTKTISDLKQSIYLETQYRAKFSNQLTNISTTKKEEPTSSLKATTKKKEETMSVKANDSSCMKQVKSNSTQQVRCETQNKYGSPISHSATVQTTYSSDVAQKKPSLHSYQMQQSKPRANSFGCSPPATQGLQPTNVLPGYSRNQELTSSTEPKGPPVIKHSTNLTYNSPVPATPVSVADSAYNNIRNVLLEKQQSSTSASSVTTHHNKRTQPNQTRDSTRPNLLQRTVRSSEFGNTSSSPQECAKIAQQIAEMHEKQRAERERNAQKLKPLLNSRNIPSSSQISNMLNLHLKNKNASQSPLIQKSRIVSEQMEQELRKPYHGDPLENMQVLKPKRKYTTKSSYDKTDMSNTTGVRQGKKNKDPQPVSCAIQMAAESLPEAEHSQTMKKQKIYLATPSVVDKLTTDSTGNLSLEDTKGLSVKPVFSMVVPKSLTSPKNQETLMKTVTNMVQKVGTNAQFSQPNVQSYNKNTALLTNATSGSTIQQEIMAQSKHQEMISQPLPAHVVDFLKNTNKKAVTQPRSSSTSSISSSLQAAIRGSGCSGQIAAQMTSNNSKNSSSIGADMKPVHNVTAQVGSNIVPDSYMQMSNVQSHLYSCNSYTHPSSGSSNYSLSNIQSSVTQSGVSDQIFNQIPAVFTQENVPNFNVMGSMQSLTEFPIMQQTMDTQMLNRQCVTDRATLDQSQMINNQYLTLGQPILDQTIVSTPQMINSQQHIPVSRQILVNQQQISPAVAQVNIAMQATGITPLYQMQDSSCQRVVNVQNVQAAPSQQIVNINTPENMNIVPQQPMVNNNPMNQMVMQSPVPIGNTLDQTSASSMHGHTRSIIGQTVAINTNVTKQKSAPKEEISPSVLQHILSDLMKAGSIKQNPKTGELEITDSGASSQEKVLSLGKERSKPSCEYENMKRSVLEATKTLLQKRQAKQLHKPELPNTDRSHSNRSLAQTLAHTTSNLAQSNFQHSSRSPIVTNVQIPNESLITSTTISASPSSNTNLNRTFRQTSVPRKQRTSQIMSVPTSLPDLPDLGSKEFAIDSILNLDNQLDVGSGIVADSHSHAAAKHSYSGPLVTYTASSESTCRNQSLPSACTLLNRSKENVENTQIQKAENASPQVLLTEGEANFQKNPSQTSQNVSVPHSSFSGAQSTYFNANRLARDREDRESNMNNVEQPSQHQTNDVHVKGTEKASSSRAIPENATTTVNCAVSQDQCNLSSVSNQDYASLKQDNEAQQKNQMETSLTCHSKLALFEKHAKTEGLTENSELMKLRDMTCSQYYFCTKCNFANKKADIVSRHVDLCSKTVQTISHVKAELGVVYQCEMCMAKFVEKESVDTHITKHCPKRNSVPIVKNTHNQKLTTSILTSSPEPNSHVHISPDVPINSSAHANKNIILDHQKQNTSVKSIEVKVGVKLEEKQENKKTAVVQKELSQTNIEIFAEQGGQDNTGESDMKMNKTEIDKTIEEVITRNPLPVDENDQSDTAVKAKSLTSSVLLGNEKKSLGNSQKKQVKEITQPTGKKSAHCLETESMVTVDNRNCESRDQATGKEDKLKSKAATKKIVKCLSSADCDETEYKKGKETKKIMSNKKSDIKMKLPENKNTDLALSRGSDICERGDSYVQDKSVTANKPNTFEKAPEDNVIGVKQIDKDNELYRLYDVHLAKQVRERIEKEKAKRNRQQMEADKMQKIKQDTESVSKEKVAEKKEFISKEKSEHIHQKKETQLFDKDKEKQIGKENETVHIGHEKEAENNRIDNEAECGESSKRHQRKPDTIMKVPLMTSRKERSKGLKEVGIASQKVSVLTKKKHKVSEVCNTEGEPKLKTIVSQRLTRRSSRRNTHSGLKRTTISPLKKPAINPSISSNRPKRFLKQSRFVSISTKDKLHSKIHVRRSPQETRNRRLRSLRSVSSIKKRIFLIDEMEPIGSSHVNCKICGDKTFSRTLARHYSHVHHFGFVLESDCFRCEYCTFSCPSPSSIKLHVQRHADQIIKHVHKLNTQRSGNSNISKSERNVKQTPTTVEPITSSDESPRSAKLRKHLKALASRSRCADRLRKISEQASNRIDSTTEEPISHEFEMKLCPVNMINDGRVTRSKDRKRLKCEQPLQERDSSVNKNERLSSRSPTTSNVSEFSVVSNVKDDKTRSRSSSVSSRSSVNVSSVKRKSENSKDTVSTKIEVTNGSTKRRYRNKTMYSMNSPVSDTSSEQRHSLRRADSERAKQSNNQKINLSTDSDTSENEMRSRILTRSKMRKEIVPSTHSIKDNKDISETASAGFVKQRTSSKLLLKTSSDDEIKSTSKSSEKQRKLSGSSSAKDDGTFDDNVDDGNINPNLLSEVQQSPIAKRTRYSTTNVDAREDMYSELYASDSNTSENDAKVVQEQKLQKQYKHSLSRVTHSGESEHVPRISDTTNDSTKILSSSLKRKKKKASKNTNESQKSDKDNRVGNEIVDDNVEYNTDARETCRLLRNSIRKKRKKNIFGGSLDTVKNQTLIGKKCDPAVQLPLDQHVKHTKKNLESCARSDGVEKDEHVFSKKTTSLAVMLHPDDDDEFSSLKALPVAPESSSVSGVSTTEQRLDSTVLLGPDEEFCPLVHKKRSEQSKPAAALHLDKFKEVPMESTVLFNPADEFSGIQLPLHSRKGIVSELKPGTVKNDSSMSKAKPSVTPECLANSVLLSPDDEFSDICSNTTDRCADSTTHKIKEKGLSTAEDCKDMTKLESEEGTASETNKEKIISEENDIVLSDAVKPSITDDCLVNSVLLNPDEEFSDLYSPNTVVKGAESSFDSHNVVVDVGFSQRMSTDEECNDDTVANVSSGEEVVSTSCKQSSSSSKLNSKVQVEKHVGQKPSGKFDSEYFKFAETRMFKNYNKENNSSDSDSSPIPFDLEETDKFAKASGDSSYSMMMGRKINENEAVISSDENRKNVVTLPTSNQSHGFISEFESFFCQKKTQVVSPSRRKSKAFKNGSKISKPFEKNESQQDDTTKDILHSDINESQTPKCMPVSVLPECSVLLEKLQYTNYPVIADTCTQETNEIFDVIVIDSDTDDDATIICDDSTDSGEEISRTHSKNETDVIRSTVDGMINHVVANTNRPENNSCPERTLETVDVRLNETVSQVDECKLQDGVDLSHSEHDAVSEKCDHSTDSGEEISRTHSKYETDVIRSTVEGMINHVVTNTNGPENNSCPERTLEMVDVRLNEIVSQVDECKLQDGVDLPRSEHDAVSEKCDHSTHSGEISRTPSRNETDVIRRIVEGVINHVVANTNRPENNSCPEQTLEMVDVRLNETVSQVGECKLQNDVDLPHREHDAVSEKCAHSTDSGEEISRTHSKNETDVIRSTVEGMINRVVANTNRPENNSCPERTLEMVDVRLNETVSQVDECKLQDGVDLSHSEHDAVSEKCDHSTDSGEEISRTHTKNETDVIRSTVEGMINHVVANTNRPENISCPELTLEAVDVRLNETVSQIDECKLQYDVDAPHSEHDAVSEKNEFFRNTHSDNQQRFNKQCLFEEVESIDCHANPLDSFQMDVEEVVHNVVDNVVSRLLVVSNGSKISENITEIEVKQINCTVNQKDSEVSDVLEEMEIARSVYPTDCDSAYDVTILCDNSTGEEISRTNSKNETDVITSTIEQMIGHVVDRSNTNRPEKSRCPELTLEMVDVRLNETVYQIGECKLQNDVDAPHSEHDAVSGKSEFFRNTHSDNQQRFNKQCPFEAVESIDWHPNPLDDFQMDVEEVVHNVVDNVVSRLLVASNGLNISESLTENELKQINSKSKNMENGQCEEHCTVKQKDSDETDVHEEIEIARSEDPADCKHRIYSVDFSATLGSPALEDESESENSSKAAEPLTNIESVGQYEQNYDENQFESSNVKQFPVGPPVDLRSSSDNPVTHVSPELEAARKDNFNETLMTPIDIDVTGHTDNSVKENVNTLKYSSEQVFPVIVSNILSVANITKSRQQEPVNYELCNQVAQDVSVTSSMEQSSVATVVVEVQQSSAKITSCIEAKMECEVDDECVTMNTGGLANNIYVDSIPCDSYSAMTPEAMGEGENDGISCLDKLVTKTVAVETFVDASSDIVVNDTSVSVEKSLVNDKVIPQDEPNNASVQSVPAVSDDSSVCSDINNELIVPPVSLPSETTSCILSDVKPLLSTILTDDENIHTLVNTDLFPINMNEINTECSNYDEVADIDPPEASAILLHSKSAHCLELCSNKTLLKCQTLVDSDEGKQKSNSSVAIKTFEIGNIGTEITQTHIEEVSKMQSSDNIEVSEMAQINDEVSSELDSNNVSETSAMKDANIIFESQQSDVSEACEDLKTEICRMTNSNDEVTLCTQPSKMYQIHQGNVEAMIEVQKLNNVTETREEENTNMEVPSELQSNSVINSSETGSGPNADAISKMPNENVLLEEHPYTTDYCEVVKNIASVEELQSCNVIETCEMSEINMDITETCDNAQSNVKPAFESESSNFQKVNVESTIESQPCSVAETSEVLGEYVPDVSDSQGSDTTETYAVTNDKAMLNTQPSNVIDTCEMTRENGLEVISSNIEIGEITQGVIEGISEPKQSTDTATCDITTDNEQQECNFTEMCEATNIDVELVTKSQLHTVTKTSKLSDNIILMVPDSQVIATPDTCELSNDNVIMDSQSHNGIEKSEIKNVNVMEVISKSPSDIEICEIAQRTVEGISKPNTDTRTSEITTDKEQQTCNFTETCESTNKNVELIILSQLSNEVCEESGRPKINDNMSHSINTSDMNKITNNVILAAQQSTVLEVLEIPQGNDEVMLQSDSKNACATQDMLNEKMILGCQPSNESLSCEMSGGNDEVIADSQSSCTTEETHRLDEVTSETTFMQPYADAVTERNSSNTTLICRPMQSNIKAMSQSGQITSETQRINDEKRLKSNQAEFNKMCENMEVKVEVMSDLKSNNVIDAFEFEKNFDIEQSKYDGGNADSATVLDKMRVPLPCISQNQELGTSQTVEENFPFNIVDEIEYVVDADLAMTHTTVSDGVQSTILDKHLDMKSESKNKNVSEILDSIAALHETVTSDCINEPIVVEPELFTSSNISGASAMPDQNTVEFQLSEDIDSSSLLRTCTNLAGKIVSLDTPVLVQEECTASQTCEGMDKQAVLNSGINVNCEMTDIKETTVVDNFQDAEYIAIPLYRDEQNCKHDENKIVNLDDNMELSKITEVDPMTVQLPDSMVASAVSEKEYMEKYSEDIDVGIALPKLHSEAPLNISEPNDDYENMRRTEENKPECVTSNFSASKDSVTTEKQVERYDAGVHDVNEDSLDEILLISNSPLPTDIMCPTVDISTTSASSMDQQANIISFDDKSFLKSLNSVCETDEHHMQKNENSEIMCRSNLRTTLTQKSFTSTNVTEPCPLSLHDSGIKLSSDTTTHLSDSKDKHVKLCEHSYSSPTKQVRKNITAAVTKKIGLRHCAKIIESTQLTLPKPRISTSKSDSKDMHVKLSEHSYSSPTKPVQKNVTVTKKIGSRKSAKIIESTQLILPKPRISTSKNYCEEVKRLISKSKAKSRVQHVTSVIQGKTPVRKLASSETSNISKVNAILVQKAPLDMTSETDKVLESANSEQKVSLTSDITTSQHSKTKITNTNVTHATVTTGQAHSGIVKDNIKGVSCIHKSIKERRVDCSNENQSQKLKTNVHVVHKEEIKTDKETKQSDANKSGIEPVVNDDIDFKRRTENVKKALKKSHVKPYQSDFDICDDDGESVISTVSSTNSTNSFESKHLRLQDFANETKVSDIIRNTSPLFMLAQTNTSPEKVTVSRMATKLAPSSKYESPSMAQKIFSGDIVKKYSRRMSTEIVKPVLTAPVGTIRDCYLLPDQVPVSHVQYPDIKASHCVPDSLNLDASDNSVDSLASLTTSTDHFSNQESLAEADRDRERGVKLHLLRESRKDEKAFSWDDPQAEKNKRGKSKQLSKSQRQTRSSSPQKRNTEPKQETVAISNNKQNNEKSLGNRTSRVQSKRSRIVPGEVVDASPDIGSSKRNRSLSGETLDTSNRLKKSRGNTSKSTSLERKDTATGLLTSKRSRSASSENSNVSKAKLARIDTDETDAVLDSTSDTMNCCCSVDDLANACEKCLKDAEICEPHVRRVIHGGKVFEIKRGNIKETNIKKDLIESVSNDPVTSKGSTPSRITRLSSAVKNPVEIKHKKITQQIASNSSKRSLDRPIREQHCMESQSRSASVQAVGNLNEYICATLNEIRKQRSSASGNKGSKWKMPRKAKISARFPYSFKKTK